jgi:hypothetical protein
MCLILAVPAADRYCLPDPVHHRLRTIKKIAAPNRVPQKFSAMDYFDKL